MKGLSLRSTIAISISLALLLIVPATGSAEIEGLYLVSAGHDTADTGWVSIEPRAVDCAWYTAGPNDPSFRRENLVEAEAEWDIDLLISNTLLGALEVTPAEVGLLIDTFDGDLSDNYFSADERDLELVVNYLSVTSAYEDLGSGSANFELFPTCAADGIPLAMYRDETDFYLVAEGEGGGVSPSHFKDILEDWPYSSTWPVETSACDEWNGEAWICDEFKENSFQTTDSGGNAEGDETDWPLKAASGASHEFGHVLWASNGLSYGRRSNHGNFNELFSTASVILSNPPTGSVDDDVPYAQSLLYVVAGPNCTYESCGPTNVPDWADHQDCRTGYVNWGLWTTYLMGHFHEGDYSDDVLYKWARVQDPPDTGPLRQDMCGLASVLDDSMYSYLGGSGGSPGGERLCRVFHDFSVAKWVDSAVYETTGRYLFPNYSPRRDFDLFNKNDRDTGPFAIHNYWELPVPPTFMVSYESDGSWQHVPGNASDSLSGCTTGWNDPRDTSYCGNTYCDPVKVRLWGSYYIGFAADTDYYDSNDDRYLEIKLNWGEGAMHDSTELWVSILKYSDYTAPGDSLFLDGGYLKQVLTDQFAPGDSVVIVVPDFNEGGSEAAAVVLSLVPTVSDPVSIDCTALTTKTVCLPRRANDYPSRDLEFTYSFIVTDGSEGSGGCPFAEVLTEDGYKLDNNVLVGGTLGGDVEDYYVLDTDPILDEGVYRLRLTEDESDLSHFDRVSLLVADLPEGQELGVLDGRGLVAYTRAGSPVLCRDESGASLLASVASDDGDLVVLPAGSWIDVHLPSGGRAGGGAGIDGGPSHKIDPPMGGRGNEVGQGVLDLTPLCYRGNECTNIIPLPDSTPVEDGLAKFHVSTSVDYHLDQLFSAEFLDEAVRTEPCRLVSALHSDTRDVAEDLSSGDGHTADLGRGEEIELAFTAPDLEPGRTRRFALVTQGRYEHLAGRLDDEVETDLPLVLSATAYPNPFTPMTTIRFAIPSPGGDVSVRVYNIAGRLVRDLGRDDLPPGIYELEWDGRNNQGERVATGVYFYSVRTPSDSVRRKVVLLK
jgi:hypothetical protein